MNSHKFNIPGTFLKIINKMAKKKSPGIDRITNTALKVLQKNMILTLTKILNDYFRLCYFTLTWKTTSSILISKPVKFRKNQ